MGKKPTGRRADLRALPSVAPVAQPTTPPTPPAVVEGSLALAEPNTMSAFYAGAQAMSNTGQWPNQAPGKPFPSMPRVPDNKPLLKNMGAPGTAIFSGIITNNGEYNPDFFWRDGLKIFDQMRRNDGQVFAVLQMLELPIRAATWDIQPASDDPKDIEIAAFVKSALFDEMCYTTTEGRTVRQKWDDILRHILLMLPFGFSMFEQVWRVEDGWVKWARWTPLLPTTLWRWWVGADNELTGIQQWTFRDWNYQFIDIPADKLLLFSHRQEGNNYQGVSVLRSAYKHWYYKDNFYKIEAIGIERNGVVLPVVKLPPNHTEQDVAMAQQIAQNIRANEYGGITLPYGWDLEYPKNMQKYASPMQEPIAHHDVMIARNVLAQFLNLGSTETGAYALADQQVQTFYRALEAECEYIKDVINTDAIRRLVDYNFVGVEKYPTLTSSKLISQDLQMLSTTLQTLSAYLPPNPELNDYLAKLVGIPMSPVSETNTTDPSSPSTPERPDVEPNDHSTQEPTQSRPRGTSGADQADSPDGGDAGDGASEGLGAEVRLLRETIAALLGDGGDAVEQAEVFAATRSVREERPLEQQTHAQLRVLAHERGVKPGRSKAVTIARLRAASPAESVAA